MSWQPIETAPKDGSRIMLWFVPECGVRCAFGFYYDSQLWGPVWDYEGGCTVAIEGATHWQPIPEGPD